MKRAGLAESRREHDALRFTGYRLEAEYGSIVIGSPNKGKQGRSEIQNFLSGRRMERLMRASGLQHPGITTEYQIPETGWFIEFGAELGYGQFLSVDGPVNPGKAHSLLPVAGTQETVYIDSRNPGHGQHDGLRG